VTEDQHIGEQRVSNHVRDGVESLRVTTERNGVPTQ